MSDAETLNKDFAGEGMYRENILDHFKHPRHFGKIKNASVSHTEYNPVCGDTITFDVIFDAKEKVKEIKFHGHGCAISISAASVLTDELVGKSKKEIEKLARDDIVQLLGIELGPVRLKCAMLSLDTIKNAARIHNKYIQNPAAGGK